MPILSRMVERLIVKDHIFPSIYTEELFNQYCFKKTGSTTAAIIDITHTISVVRNQQICKLSADRLF